MCMWSGRSRSRLNRCLPSCGLTRTHSICYHTVGNTSLPCICRAFAAVSYTAGRRCIFRSLHATVDRVFALFVLSVAAYCWWPRSETKKKRCLFPVLLPACLRWRIVKRLALAKWNLTLFRCTSLQYRPGLQALCNLRVRLSSCI